MILYWSRLGRGTIGGWQPSPSLSDVVPIPTTGPSRSRHSHSRPSEVPPNLTDHSVSEIRWGSLRNKSETVFKQYFTTYREPFRPNRTQWSRINYVVRPSKWVHGGVPSPQGTIGELLEPSWGSAGSLADFLKTWVRSDVTLF